MVYLSPRLSFELAALTAFRKNDTEKVYKASLDNGKIGYKLEDRREGEEYAGPAYTLVDLIELGKSMVFQNQRSIVGFYSRLHKLPFTIFPQWEERRKYGFFHFLELMTNPEVLGDILCQAIKNKELVFPIPVFVEQDGEKTTIIEELPFNAPIDSTQEIQGSPENSPI